MRGLTILERGWLSSNNVLLHGGGAGAVLIDASHALHGEQTVALVRQALAGEPLRRVVNTHLHSDHCGGNAALARAFGWTPQQIGELTLGQILLHLQMLREERDGDG